MGSIMKKLLFAALVAVSVSAHAQSWFQFEAGAGYSIGQDSGDGQWVQQALPHNESLSAPAGMLGVTGTLYDAGSWGLAYHVDAIVMGRVSASTMAVADADYNDKAHEVIAAEPETKITGHGQEWGVYATLEPYVMYSGLRFAVNGGAYAFHQTWDITAIQPTGQVQTLSHNPAMAYTWTAGASVSKGPWTLSYQYLADRGKWNPNPGIIEKTHLILLRYTF